jgi:hypothetical protein
MRQLADELCTLFQRQIDTLQRGLSAEELDQYLHRREQIDELQAQLKALRSQPS